MINTLKTEMELGNNGFFDGVEVSVLSIKAFEVEVWDEYGNSDIKDMGEIDNNIKTSDSTTSAVDDHTTDSTDDSMDDNMWGNSTSDYSYNDIWGNSTGDYSYTDSWGNSTGDYY